MASILDNTASIPQPSNVPAGDASQAFAVKRLAKQQMTPPLKKHPTGPPPMPVLRRY